MESESGATHEVLEVGEFYQLLTSHLESAFGRRRPHWVRGEIAKVYEKSHVYIDLVDAGSTASDTKRPVLNTHCWATQWAPIRRQLADDGVTLKPGVIVNFFGYVDLYAPQGKIGFTITQIDVQSLLGDVARRRLELIARLRTEGLLEMNKHVERSALPLRVGLVASPGTEGYQDFTGQLLTSGFGFEITMVTTTVQGDSAPAQIVRAIGLLDTHGVDLICIVRGGGSKGDLACFDDERVARTIAHCTTPVFTGIGHTGDETIADLVAHTRAITPTKLGEEIVALVADWRQRRVVTPATVLLDATSEVLDEANEYVRERRRAIVRAVRERLRSEQRHLATTRASLATHSRHVVANADEALRIRRQLLSAYDPKRRLAQGWSILTNAHGDVVSALADVAIGESVHIMVSDGILDSQISGKNGAG